MWTSGVTRWHQKKRPRWCRRENMRRLGLIRPGPCPVTLSRRAAGRQRVFVGASGGVVACSLGCGWSLAIAGVQSVAPQSVRAGVTPAVHLRGLLR